MDWKLLLSTFGAIFVAELGDKTQIATLTLAAGGKSRWAVFLGSSLALVATSAIGVLVGQGLSKALPPIWLQRIAGVVFLGMGLLFLLKRPEA